MVDDDSIRGGSGARSILADALAVLAQAGLLIGVPFGLAFREGHPPLPTWADAVLTTLLVIDAAVLLRRARRASPLRLRDGAGSALDLLAALPLARLTGMPALELLRLLKLFRVVGRVRVPARSEAVSRTAARLLIFAMWAGLTVHGLACGWVTLHPGTTKSGFDHYLEGWYWCITTLATVGYGDIVPVTNVQRVYTMAVMVLGVGAYGYVVGNVASLLGALDQGRAEYDQQLDRLSAFLRYRKVPREMTTRILDHYDHLWHQRRGLDESGVLRGLPRALQEELAVVLRQDVVSKVPLLKEASGELLRELCIVLSPALARAGDTIVRLGEPGRKMYFIVDGTVAFLDAHGTELDRASGGEFFGELALLTDQPRRATVVAVEPCDLYELDKHAFLHVLERHPEFAAHVYAVAAARGTSTAASRAPLRQ